MEKIQVYIQTEQVVFVYLEIYMYTHMNVTIINEKEAINLKEHKDEYFGGFCWGKVETEMMQLYYNHKNEKI